MPDALSEPRPYRSAIPITPGGRVKHGRGVYISCTVSGLQAIQLAGQGVILVAVTAGQPLLLDNFAVVDAPVAGTTATATVYVLD